MARDPRSPGAITFDDGRAPLALVRLNRYSGADGAADALELLHRASLAHDDMSCFDNAATRRGKPSVHRAYGEDLALLVGDALIGRICMAPDPPIADTRAASTP